MFNEGFFLPAASKPAHDLLKKAARRLVNTYLRTYGDDLFRIWERSDHSNSIFPPRSSTVAPM
jgi:hypothetical protein